MRSRDAKAMQIAPLATPTNLEPDAVREVAGAHIGPNAHR